MSQNNNSQTDNRPHYWLILIGLFLISIILGVIGFGKYYDINHSPYTIIRSIYCSIALFALNGGDLLGIIPWELDVARFTAPLTTISAFIIALFGIFHEQWNRLKISMKRNHVVIIGFGKKGKSIMDESLSKGDKIIVIENNPLNPNLGYIKPPGCHLLKADATDIITLKRAKISKAKTVFLMMGDDAQQIDSCLHIYKLIQKSKRGKSYPLHCVMHLQKQEFINTLRIHKLMQDTCEAFVLNIFSIYENSARELFENNPPDRSGISFKSKSYIQMIIFGFGKAGEALALQTALTGHYLNGKKPHVLIIDRLAKEKVPNFLDRYPSYTSYCELDYFSFDANTPQLINHIEKYVCDPFAYTSIILCFDNETQNMLLGLQMETLDLNETGYPLHIFVRTNDNASFKSFSQTIKPYGLPSKVCSWKVIAEGDLDHKVRAIHNQYLKKRMSESDFGIKDADVNWEKLLQEYKDSNRNAADHIGVKMRGIGCEIVNKDDPRPSATFSEEEIERLSELEHQRWNAERSLAGWTFNKQKNNTTRKTPFLTDWDKLAEDIKEYDRDAVRNIPSVLEWIDMKPVRQENQ